MSLKVTFHRPEAVNAHGSDASFWVSAREGLTDATIFFDQVAAERIHRQLGEALAERALIAEARAKAKEAA